MAIAQELVDFARGEVGYYRHDDPEQGTKYGRWFAELTGDSYYAQNGIPFCAMFGSYVAAMVGVQSPVTPAACTFDERDDLQGRRVDRYNLQTGDFITFDWDADWKGDHFGICDHPNGDGSYTTIEGNVDGGRVKYCTRWPSEIICGCRPWYDDVDKPDTDGKLDTDGVAGVKTVTKLQQAYGTLDDGVISSQLHSEDEYRPNVWAVDYNDEGAGSALILTMQHDLRNRGYYYGAFDGCWGVNFTRALQMHLKNLGYYTDDIDDWFGKRSVIALQNALNDGALGV